MRVKDLDPTTVHIFHHPYVIRGLTGVELGDTVTAWTHYRGGELIVDRWRHESMDDELHLSLIAMIIFAYLWLTTVDMEGETRS